jgi:hypothetical protein
MAAATLAGTRSTATWPKGGAGDSYNVKAAYGTITVDSATEDGDIWQLCRLPAGSTVIGGWLMGGDGDTGIETLDIDLGWAANGVDAADPDGFGNLGVWTGDASKTAPTGNHFVLAGVLQSAGPKTFTVDTLIQAETNAAAATGVAMELTVVVLYLYKNP